MHGFQDAGAGRPATEKCDRRPGSFGAVVSATGRRRRGGWHAGWAVLGAAVASLTGVWMCVYLSGWVGIDVGVDVDKSMDMSGVWVWVWM